MKVSVRCGYCLLHRGYKMILRATEDEDKQIEAMKNLLEFLGKNYNESSVPSFLGTERDRIIRRVTDCPDPYRSLKKLANKKALEILPSMVELVKKAPEKERLRMACKLACLGNVIEYDVPGHDSNIDKALEAIDEEFYIDDIDRIVRKIGSGNKIVYLTDNAGEIALDRLVVREFKKLGCQVTVAVKGGPSLNDALMVDAETVGMTNEADQVITTGTDAVGIKLDEASTEFKDKFYNSDIIISKGMANWETLTETPVPCPTMFLLRTKCDPVAKAVEAPLHRCIAKLVPKGWRL